MSKSLSDHLFIALDHMNDQDALRFVAEYKTLDLSYKIGMELFYKYGPEIVWKIKEQKAKKIFLDLKLNDIPTTIQKSIESVQALPIDFLTIHLNSGKQTLLKAMETLEGQSHINLIGVSLLTSIGKEEIELIYNNTYQNQLLRFFDMAQHALIKYIVCSPIDLKILAPLRDKNSDIKFICPGIHIHRPNTGQVRSVTLGEAVSLGADYLVVGRSITQSASPKDSIALIKETLEKS